MADIIGRIKLDASGVQAGANTATSAIKKFANDVKGTIATMFGGAAFVSAIRKTIAEIDQIGDVSEEFDMPVEQVKALMIAATEASDEFEKLHAILTKIQDIQIDIVKGDTSTGLKNRALLQRHGVDSNAINNMSLTEFAKVIANNITNKTELNQLLGPRMAGKFEIYRKSLQDLDANVAKGITLGRIKTKAEIDEINKIVSEGKRMWGTLWDTIMNRLFSIGYVLSKIVEGFQLIYSKLPKPIKGVVDTLIDPFGSTISSVKKFAISKGWMKAVPGAIPSGGPLVADPGGGPLFTDPLLSVGNFLGQGMQNITMVTSLVEETKKQTEILKQIETTNGKIFEKMLRGDPALEWPFPPVLGKAFIKFFNDLGKGWEP